MLHGVRLFYQPGWVCAVSCYIDVAAVAQVRAVWPCHTHGGSFAGRPDSFIVCSMLLTSYRYTVPCMINSSTNGLAVNKTKLVWFEFYQVKWFSSCAKFDDFFFSRIFLEVVRCMSLVPGVICMFQIRGKEDKIDVNLTAHATAKFFLHRCWAENGHSCTSLVSVR